jgi:hypothetical protein
VPPSANFGRSRYNRASEIQRSALEAIRDSVTGDPKRIRTQTLNTLLDRGWVSPSGTGHALTEAGHDVLARDPL